MTGAGGDRGVRKTGKQENRVTGGGRGRSGSRGGVLEFLVLFVLFWCFSWLLGGTTKGEPRKGTKTAKGEPRKGTKTAKNHEMAAGEPRGAGRGAAGDRGKVKKGAGWMTGGRRGVQAAGAVF